jgi:stage II sporulation protein D
LCLTLALTRSGFWTKQVSRNKTPAPAADDLDQRLKSAATAALGEGDGAIVVLDPQTGRVLAVVQPELAFRHASTPGSIIKPFTALAALRTNTITADTRLRCRAKYKRSDAVATCSHPPNLGPFKPADALAYSCNYYFAKVGERLPENDFANLLAEFGFGQQTGINSDQEAAGALVRARWQPESAIGEGEFLQATPLQIAMAYAAIFNGGRLFRPTFAAATGFTPRLRAQLRVAENERLTLLEGMRGAVTFGTAKQAGLTSLPTYIVGKTGTSTPLQGFRSQGWFAGVAFASNAETEPADAQLVVVVYLQHGHGAEAAEVARAVFEEAAGSRDSESDTTWVSVHQVAENSTQRMPLEQYLVRVVSSEASVEDQPEALKALAVVARTYALKNLGRHKEDGYNFCSTTHCQRFETVTPRTALADAVRKTSGLVLRDDQDRIIDAYFSASCGGVTANLKTLWGVEAPPYLRGVQDNYCSLGTHYRWTDTISTERLAKALRSDPRTDVGETIRSLAITKSDASGRAELISIAGDRTRTISGWEFKLIVGRALGWNVLKSSRFRVSRAGSQFVFRGGGFGHGLGLCQEGSHVMAERGYSYQQILAHYFPDTTVGEYDDNITRRSSHFRLVYPRTGNTDDSDELLRLLETNRAELLHRVSAAGVDVQFPNLEIVFNQTTGDFVGRTGMPSWAAAATRKNQIQLQPLKLLKQRQILETTLRHELVHVLIETIGNGQTPRWLSEGMAAYFSGEGRLLEHEPDARTPAAVERALASARSASEMRAAYAAAYKLVKDLIRTQGENKVWKSLAIRSYSVNVTLVPTLTANGSEGCANENPDTLDRRPLAAPLNCTHGHKRAAAKAADAREAATKARGLAVAGANVRQPAAR